jgi:tetratricopeptide (TPR) repeat protein
MANSRPNTNLPREIGDRQGETLTLNNIANSCTGLGQFEQALAK